MSGSTSDPAALHDSTQFLIVVIGIASFLVKMRHPAPLTASSATDSRMPLSCLETNLAATKNRTSRSRASFFLSKTKTWSAVHNGGVFYLSLRGKQVNHHIEKRRGKMSQERTRKIHEATMRILQDTGLRFLHPDAIAILKEHGIHVENNVAYFTKTRLWNRWAKHRQALTCSR